MSLILDALNKSRSDNEAVPGLGAEHYREEPTKPWLRYLPWAGLALAVLVIAWLLLGEDETDETIVTPVAELSRNLGSAATSVTNELKARAEEGREKRATAVPGPTAAPVAAPATPASTPSAAPPTPAQQAIVPPPAAAPPKAPAKRSTAAADPEAIKALYDKRRRAGDELLERAARAKAAEAKAAEDRAAEANAKEAQAAQARAEEAAAAARELEERPVDVEEVLRLAQEEVANAELVDHPAPFLVSLSQQTKNAIPTILYQRHDYSQGGRASVTLNGKTLRTGGTVDSGLKIDEILEDSVILNYRGTQFRLRALNSWVNL